jgi:hypothetical protein
MRERTSKVRSFPGHAAEKQSDSGRNSGCRCAVQGGTQVRSVLRLGRSLLPR